MYESYTRYTDAPFWVALSRLSTAASLFDRLTRRLSVKLYICSRHQDYLACTRALTPLNDSEKTCANFFVASGEEACGYARAG